MLTTNFKALTQQLEAIHIYFCVGKTKPYHIKKALRTVPTEHNQKPKPIFATLFHNVFLLILSISSFLVFLQSTTVQAQINQPHSLFVFRITEVFFAGGHEDSCSDCSREKWVEITNITMLPSTLEGYNLQIGTDPNNIFVFGSDMIVPAHSSIIVTSKYGGLGQSIKSLPSHSVIETGRMNSMSRVATAPYHINVSLSTPINNIKHTISYNHNDVQTILSTISPNHVSSIEINNNNQWLLPENSYFPNHFGNPLSTPAYLNVLNYEVAAIPVPIQDNIYVPVIQQETSMYHSTEVVHQTPPVLAQEQVVKIENIQQSETTEQAQQAQTPISHTIATTHEALSTTETIQTPAHQLYANQIQNNAKTLNTVQTNATELQEQFSSELSFNMHALKNEHILASITNVDSMIDNFDNTISQNQIENQLIPSRKHLIPHLIKNTEFLYLVLLVISIMITNIIRTHYDNITRNLNAYWSYYIRNTFMKSKLNSNTEYLISL